MQGEVRGNPNWIPGVLILPHCLLIGCKCSLGNTVRSAVSVYSELAEVRVETRNSLPSHTYHPHPGLCPPTSCPGKQTGSWGMGGEGEENRETSVPSPGSLGPWRNFRSIWYQGLLSPRDFDLGGGLPLWLPKIRRSGHICSWPCRSSHTGRCHCTPGLALRLGSLQCGPAASSHPLGTCDHTPGDTVK